MSDQKNYKGDIFFVGDSYCDSYDFNLWKDLGCPGWQHGIKTSHLSITSEHFNYRLHPHGYGGKSWWYSRSKFLEDFRQSSARGDFDLKAIVFFHTSYSRLNNAWDDSISNTPEDDLLKSFYKNFYDDDFQLWAQAQWFHELSREYKTIKTLHFFCFDIIPDMLKILPGMVFGTPLIHISIGELTGTDQEILDKCSYRESRFNHLSEDNNRILAEIIINSLENYRPGYHELDLRKFIHVNKNATNWPKPGFGTK